MEKGLKTKFIVLLGVLGVSFSSILVRYSHAPSLVMVFYRIGLAAVLMTVPGIKSIRKEKDSITKTDVIFAVIAGIFLAFHFYGFFNAVRLSSISAATVLVDTEVFFVCFFTVFFLHEKLSKMAWLGIIITFVGSIIVSVSDIGSGTGSLTGDMWALSGAVFSAVYTVLGRKCREHMSTGSYTVIVYWSTTLTALVLLLVQGIPVTGYTTTDIACAFGMTILCTLLGHSIFSWALKFESRAFISTAKLLEPVFSSILAFVIFSELAGIPVILGGILIIIGIWLAGK